ncbi:MAG: HAMP domain-containing sensor histidine kinase [Lachnospiraceae bacterium]|nr:HAMP domain-containing sensor histidine kinase [Lachnospiraceae bacterium]
MKKTFRKIKDVFSTLSLTVLFTLNLFFIVFLFLAFVTLLVYFGVDGGFLVTDGHVTIGGALTMIYAVCIFIALSIVIMIRMVFIGPIRKIMAAMGRLAKGEFSVRIDMSNEAYCPREIREFAESFNKAAEELSGTEILRKDFINNFSHEFKTPIVSISGFADLLLDVDLPPEDQKEYLTIIRDESKRLAELSTNILTLNRIESQAILRDTENIRLGEQIRQSVLLTEQKWREKNLDFEADIEDVDYLGNETLLKEVWLNILDNAAKFSPEGAVVNVALHKKGGEIIAAVTDHGPGMDEKTRAHIFEQFYQGDTSHRSQGNGLGLAMVRKIVELHGGKVSVDSSPGNGSSFTVIL